MNDLLASIAAMLPAHPSALPALISLALICVGLGIAGILIGEKMAERLCATESWMPAEVVGLERIPAHCEPMMPPAGVPCVMRLCSR